MSLRRRSARPGRSAHRANVTRSARLETLDRRINDGNALAVAHGDVGRARDRRARRRVRDGGRGSARAAFLLANLVAGALGIGTGGGVVAVLLGSGARGLACGVVAAAARRRSRRSWPACSAAYLVSFELDERWVALSPFGPSQNARFYGISNLLETFLLVPALVGAALLWRRPWAAAGRRAARLRDDRGQPLRRRRRRRDRARRRLRRCSRPADRRGPADVVLPRWRRHRGRPGPARARRRARRVEPRHAGAAQGPRRARVGISGTASACPGTT